MPKLYIDEEGHESVYEIFDDEVTLGRGAANAVQIHDSHASKMHAVVRRVQGHWKLIDLESKNGTRINGRYRNQHWLSDGDAIAIGTSTVRYAAEGATQGSPAAAAGVAVAARPAPAKAAPAKPAPAKPAPAKPAPARAAPPPPPPPQPAPSLVEQELEAAPAPSAAPTRTRRAGAPVSARRRSQRDDRYDDDYDDYDDEERRPRYQRKSNNATIIVLGGLGAIAFIVLMFAMFGSSVSRNLETFTKADKMARVRDYEGAIRYAEANADPDGDDYARLLRGLRKWKRSLQAQRDMEYDKKAREYYDYQIFRQQAITGRRPGGFRAKDALPDDEVVKLLREFLQKYRGTSPADEIMHSEVADFRHFRDAMREYADENLKATTVLQAEAAQLDIDVSARQFGKAVMNLEYVRDMNRLCMTADNYEELRQAVQLKLDGILDQARTTFQTESSQFKAHMNNGRRGQARQLLEKMKDQYGGIDELARRVRELEQRF
ncbi:MAG: FHA domain-containing protein [Planctomycetota bacterium]|nr:FHA domain-containing protein [Planctomycetota bacterium]